MTRLLPSGQTLTLEPLLHGLARLGWTRAGDPERHGYDDVW